MNGLQEELDLEKIVVEKVAGFSSDKLEQILVVSCLKNSALLKFQECIGFPDRLITGFDYLAAIITDKKSGHRQNTIPPLIYFTHSDLSYCRWCNDKAGTGLHATSRYTNQQNPHETVFTFIFEFSLSDRFAQMPAGVRMGGGNAQNMNIGRFVKIVDSEKIKDWNLYPAITWKQV